MTNRIPEIFGAMPERAMIADQVAAYREYSQNEGFFHLAREKAARIAMLRERFAGRRIQRLFVGAHFAGIGFELPAVEVVTMARGWFERGLGDGLPALLAELAGAIVLVGNNDLAFGQAAPGFIRAYAQADDTIFLGWDHDNHHWMNATLTLAGHTDLYFPAHNENMFLLSRVNPLTAGPVPCGTIQWTKRLLAEQLGTMLSTRRHDEPLGRHVFYEAFKYRNQAVVTLNRHFKDIGFTEPSFAAKTPVERMAEWIAHKSHWIIPVLNDVPIRIFDALSTGGIPIVPESLRFLAPVADIPREHIAFYGPDDLIDPRAVAARAVALFDAGGPAGIAERHRLGLTAHHGSVRFHRMLAMAQERLEFAPLIG